MDAQAKTEMHDRAERVADEILNGRGILQKKWLLNLIFTALQEQDVSARKRAAEASIRELKSICEKA